MLSEKDITGASLAQHGIHNINAVYANLTAAQLVEHAVQRQEGHLAANGALVVRTGQFTGRSPKDKFIVRDEVTGPAVQWGAVNQPMSEAHFDRLYHRLANFWQGQDIYVQDCRVGADPEYGMPIRVISQLAWHSLFARQLFIGAETPAREGGQGHQGTLGGELGALGTALGGELGGFGAALDAPGNDARQQAAPFTILFAPDFQADPATEGTKSETCIAIDFKKRVVLIVGTSYAGEVKKSAFTILNYLLPERAVFPMHCSANVGPAGDVALFFGLSGTGKTTLSADPERRLIGDDETGWSDEGVFNFEGGCYAKCIRLSHQNEPQIWGAIRFGTVLENVPMDAHTRELDYNSEEITENTRAAYPLDYIEGAVLPSVGGHPTNVFFLTADAFGVLPPISHLTPEQAMYHFLSGYTAKIAGTERGLGKEPEATFSACFGAPFLPRPAAVYASLLGERLRRHRASCWLVNTGWVGGPFGVGSRIQLPYTRAMLHAALSGALARTPMATHPIFKLAVPRACPGVPSHMLDARAMWRDGEAYDRAARDLSARFAKNFEKFGAVAREIEEAAPGMG